MSAADRSASAGSGSGAEPVPVAVRGDGIRLGQLLKLAGVADDGAHARALVADGEVAVDGAVETRRGRQLGDGALVQVGEVLLRVRAGGRVPD